MELAKKLGFKENSSLEHFLHVYKTQISTLLALIALCVVLGFASESFFRVNNLLTVLLQSSINSIIAIGMTFVIITGGIDLSVGSIVALSAAVMGEMVVNKGLTICSHNYCSWNRSYCWTYSRNGYCES